MFEELSPFDVLRVVKAARKDQKIRDEWNKKHGFFHADGSSGGNVGDLIQADLDDPCVDCNRFEELKKLSTRALEELQTLMYLGRDGIDDDGEKTSKNNVWKKACEYYGSINIADREALIDKIDEKSPFEYYIKNGLKYFDLEDNWKTLFFQLESRPNREITDEEM